MTNEQKQRLEDLKNERKRNFRKKNIKNYPFLQECLELLGEQAYVLDEEEEEKILDIFNEQIPFISLGTGRVDWNRLNNVKEIKDFEELLNVSIEKEYYIIWNNDDLSIVKSDLNSIINCIYDVLAVDFDTWLFSTKFNEIIEFYHEGEVRWGLLNDIPR